MNTSDCQDIVSIIENTRQRGNSELLAKAASSKDGMLVAPTYAIAKYINGTAVHSARLSITGKNGPVFFDNSLVYDMAKEILRLQGLNDENKVLKKEIDHLENEIYRLENEIDSQYR